MNTLKRVFLDRINKHHYFYYMIACILCIMVLMPHSVSAQEAEKEVGDVPTQETEKEDQVGEDTLGDGGLVVVSNPENRGQILCTFYTRGDNVHRSGYHASGHGWWENIDCNVTKAIVTIQLQQQINGSWEDAGSLGTKTVYSGGGSANRAAARADCTTFDSTPWRSVIDVDLIGLPDTPDKKITSTMTLYCRN